jgi:hypothetical protein
LAVALATVALVCAAGASAMAAPPAFPKHVCGYFLRSGEDFIVYNGGGVSCRRATKLIKGFVLGNPTQHGTSDADSYWTIKGQPGFRCIQSMGQGECMKGRKIAGYIIKGVG